MRFTLAKMLIAVAMVAAACAGLMYHSSGWASVVVTATLALFGWKVLQSLGRSPQERAFGVGFAVVGCAYLLLATSPLFDNLRASLATNYSLALAARAGGAPNLQMNGYFPIPYTAPVTYPTVPVPPPTSPPSTVVRSVQRRVIETTMSDEGVPVSAERIVTEQIPFELPTAGDEDARDNAADASEEDAAATANAAPPSLQPIPTSAYAAPTGNFYPSPAYRPAAMPLESIIQMGMASGSSTPLCRFFLIGHCVWSWLFGLAGGWLAACMISRRTTPPPSAS